MEVYSKLFYEDRVAPTVAERLRDEGGGDRSTRLRAIREVTQKLWEGEDDDIKAAVAAKMAAEPPVVTGDAVDVNSLQVRTPQQYHEYVTFSYGSILLFWVLILFAVLSRSCLITWMKCFAMSRLLQV